MSLNDECIKRGYQSQEQCIDVLSCTYDINREIISDLFESSLNFEAIMLEINDLINGEEL